LIKPSFTIKKQSEEGNKEVFVFEPLAEGYGYTLGTALRRVLLSSLEGWAITSVKITGVKHQFSILSGVSEDMLQFVLNLKKVRLSGEVKEDTVKIKLAASGLGEVKAGDLEVPAGMEVVNPDLVLANLADKKATLKAEMVAEKGSGYLMASERNNDTVGLIAVDANFSPVLRVNDKVEATRVGRETNYDKLVLEVETDGTITAEETIKRAAQILVDHFQCVVNPEEKGTEEVKEEKKLGVELSKLSVEELALPTRIVNALIRGGYETVADLLAAEREDLLQVKNLGAKSLEEVETALKEKGVKLFQ